MPHCILEYSTSLEKVISPSQMIAVVRQGAIDSDLFAGNDIKTRAVGYQHFDTGDDSSNFIHVTVRLLSGRTIEQRTGLCQAMLAQLKTLNLNAISLTVEAVEIEQASYAKLVRA